MQTISFRCAAKTEPGEYRTIKVTWPGPTASCDCGGYDGKICSHIDATLVAGERAMVPELERGRADEAMRVMAGRIAIPPDWKGSWRHDYRWRGLPTRKRIARAVGLSGKPVACFTGTMPRPRKELLRDAEAAGWETVDHPHRAITVLVAADPNLKSSKLVYAREHGIPILTFADWAHITTDGEILETSP